MNDEVIILDTFPGVAVAPKAVLESNSLLKFARAIQTIEDGSSNQAAVVNAERINQLIMRAEKSADEAKLELLEGVREVDEELKNYVDPLVAEYMRLEKLSKEYESKIKRGDA